eukprot:4750626-Pyramimonas_sp.AAC.1
MTEEGGKSGGGQMTFPSPLAPPPAGGTARACMRCIAAHHPAVFIIENVKNLSVKPSDGGPSNLDSIVALANEAGYLCTPLVLDALDYGVPSKRERHYVIGVRIADEKISQLDDDFEAPAWQRDMVDMIHAIAGIEGCAAKCPCPCPPPPPHHAEPWLLGSPSPS